MNKHSEPIQVIIPTTVNDYLRMRHLVPKRVIGLLPVKELIFIGNAKLCDTVNEDIDRMYNGLPVRALDEEKIIAKQPVIDYIKDRVRRIREDLLIRVRCGWYYQQFLKMRYSDICEDDYYMSWDMDTVPLRRMELFDNEGRPYFDTKREFNPGYFKTIENLLGLEKNIAGSFISEHMIFDKAYMRELIEAIMSSSMEEAGLFEVIMDAVDDDYITLGFSEFETYGTFVTHRHPLSYGNREFNSFRRGSWFVNEKDLNDDDIRWLAKDFDAITFENTDQIQDMVMLFRNPKYRNNMSAGKFYETILESGYFGEYSDGRINAGDWYAPI